jgi:hypothetical protein
LLCFVDFVKGGKQLGVLGNPFVVFLGELNRSLLVYDEDGALGHTLGPQAIVLRAHRAVGPEIREHRETDAAHPFGKNLMREYGIDTDAQDLSVACFEFFPVFFEAA